MERIKPFKRSDHVYSSEAFAELVKDAVRFFNGTPILPLPLSEKFLGAGVYAIYCTAKTGVYAPYGQKINRMAWDVPIYVGKAVPHGWRQNRIVADEGSSTELYSRLNQHAKSISAGRGLKVGDFYCRFAIFEGGAEDMISAIEAALIAIHSPLWNSVIDGFGNHDPGARRYSGQPTIWDTLHPGRSWAAKMTGKPVELAIVKQRIRDYFVGKVKAHANI